MTTLLPLLLALFGAQAAEIAEGRPVSVLICDGPVACEEDEAWVREAGAEAGLPLVVGDVLLELDSGGWTDGVDQKARLSAALQAVREGADKGQWKAVLEAVDEARDALDKWPGAVGQAVLFELSWLEGAAAFERGKDERHQAAFRQAAAILDGDPAGTLPLDDQDIRRAWLDELRKIAVGGTGTLQLAKVPDGAEVSVDGDLIARPEDPLQLLPGTHRITVAVPGAVRTWKADVPVLAERTSAVVVDVDPSQQAAWVQEQLVAGFDELALPEEVAAILRSWCARKDYAALRLVRVEPVRTLVQAPPVGVTAPPPTRPAAADGETGDYGDGIPSTYSEHVLSRYEAAREGRIDEGPRRLQVAWFEPRTGRLLQDSPIAAPLEQPESSPTRAGIHLGATGLLGTVHASLDLSLRRDLGPIWLDGRAGLARASTPYRLYPGWTDRQLYHLGVFARWQPEGPVVPYVAVGPEVFVPVAIGGRAMLGGEARVARDLRAHVEGSFGWNDGGMTWGGSLGLGRVF